MRRAQLVADAVSVLCPSCGEPQPNKWDGSEQWTADNFTALTNPRLVCVACDQPMLVTSDSKVAFDLKVRA